MSPYDEEESRPLVDNGTFPKAQSSATGTRRGVHVNRWLILLTLAGFVALSLYFQSEQTQLTQQLAIDEEKIHHLTDAVEAQELVIQRFNQSVSNADVLEKMKVLEASLAASEQTLDDKLHDTISQVNSQLEQTMQTLDQTVQKAEDTIAQEVETVKRDFEQYALRTQDQFSMENSFMVYQLAGTFTLLSCLISMWHMTAHLRKLRQPVIQRKILAILWMSPVYAVTSWFSLVFNSAEGYLAIIKDAYESYIIYQFLSFCIAVLGKGDRSTVVDLLAKRADHLTPPFRLFFCCKRDPYENDRDLADAILLQCQFFAMQFVFFRPLTTIARVVLEHYQYYGPWGAEGPNDYRAPQVYVALIQNLSIFTAFTGLLKFYHAVDKDLGWCRPFAKFLCIKGVVFMTFWQGLAITILAEATDVAGADATEWALSAQNFLICLEMLIFSIAHFHCFPTDEWEENYRANFNKAKFGDSIALGDFVADLKLIMKGNKKKKKEPSEPTVPEEDEEDEDEADEDETATEGSASVTSDLSKTTDLEDPKQALAEAIAESAEDNSPEVEEARQRVLHSGFLDDMLFVSPTQRTPTHTSSDISTPTEETTQHFTYGATYGEEEESEPPIPELPTQPTSSTPLRPSIFTTIAAMSDDTPTKPGTSEQVN